MKICEFLFAFLYVSKKGVFALSAHSLLPHAKIRLLLSWVHGKVREGAFPRSNQGHKCVRRSLALDGSISGSRDG
jgi:hypothetical protein